MEKCLICEKRLEKNEESVCGTCTAFLKWKHGEDFSRHMKELKQHFSKKPKPIKFRRKK